LEADDFVESFQIGSAVLPVGRARVIAVMRCESETEVEYRDLTGESRTLALPLTATAIRAPDLHL
jgi:hypothetical protein